MLTLNKNKTSFKVSTPRVTSLLLHTKSDWEEKGGDSKKQTQLTQLLHQRKQMHPELDKSRPHLSYVQTGIKHRQQRFPFEPKPTFHFFWAEAYFSSLLKIALAFIAIQHLQTDAATATCFIQSFPYTLLVTPPWLSQKFLCQGHHQKSTSAKQSLD